MSVETIHSRAYPSEVVAIRYAPPVFWIVMIIVFGGITSATWLSFLYGIQSWADLSSRHQLSLLVLLVAVFYMAWRIFDRRVVILLDADGIRDRRLGSVLLPWSRIKNAAAIHYEGPFGAPNYRAGILLQLDHAVTISRFFGSKSATEIFVNLRMLEIEPTGFIKHMQRFAPHIQIDTKQLDIT